MKGGGVGPLAGSVGSESDLPDVAGAGASFGGVAIGSKKAADAVASVGVGEGDQQARISEGIRGGTFGRVGSGERKRERIELFDRGGMGSRNGGCDEKQERR